MNSAKFANVGSIRTVLNELGIRPTHYAISQRWLEVVHCSVPVKISLALPVAGGESAVLNRIREAFQ